MIKERLEQHIKLEEIQTNIMFALVVGVLEWGIHNSGYVAVSVFFIFTLFDILKRKYNL